MFENSRAIKIIKILTTFLILKKKLTTFFNIKKFRNKFAPLSWFKTNSNINPTKITRLGWSDIPGSPKNKF